MPKGEDVSREEEVSPSQKDESKEINAPEERIPVEEDNSENKNPAEASKKNKKKRKKAAPTNSEDIDKKGVAVEKKEELKEILGEINDNKGENALEVKSLELLYLLS